ncbi:hypothetical protein DFLDMN_006211 (plasmid) [Cupriavidus sp. H19C3]
MMTRLGEVTRMQIEDDLRYYSRPIATLLHPALGAFVAGMLIGKFWL